MWKNIVLEVWNINHNQSLQTKIDLFSVSVIVGTRDNREFQELNKRQQEDFKNLKNKKDEDSVKKYVEESKKLSEIYVQQEVFWKQRSK